MRGEKRERMRRACTHGTEPVKLMAAKCGEAVIVSPNTGPSAGMKLTTPGGTPASRITLKMIQFDRTAVSDGFHRTEFPCKTKGDFSCF